MAACMSIRAGDDARVGLAGRRVVELLGGDLQQCSGANKGA